MGAVEGSGDKIILSRSPLSYMMDVGQATEQELCEAGGYIIMT